MLSHLPEPCQLLGLLATAIIKMDGISGQSGWRWIFILEGIVTVLFGLIAWLVMPADLGSAKFFSDEEREFAGVYTPSRHRRYNKLKFCHR